MARVGGVVRTTVSSAESLTALTKHRVVPVGGKGSHTTLRYENPDTGDVRTVTVPKADPIPTGTLQDIADQAGAEDFHEFCKWVDRTVYPCRRLLLVAGGVCLVVVEQRGGLGDADDLERQLVT